MWFRAAERKTDIVVNPLQLADTAEDTSVREPLVHFALGEMIHQFLVHRIDVKRGNLLDKLASKNILSREQTERVKKLKKVDAKVDCLMMALREKSTAEFESFLATLNETGQQSVTEFVHQALHTFGQTGQNPLRSIHGEWGLF